MIELLSRLGTKPSTFPDNQAEYSRFSQRCPECSYTRRSSLTICWRCGGTRKLGETGGQHQTRGKSDSLMTPQYIAALLAGIEKHKVDAALVHVNNDVTAAMRLMDYMVIHVISVASYGWKLDDETKSNRVAGLAAVSVKSIAQYPDRVPVKISCRLVGVGSTQWKNVWQERSEIFVSRMMGWTDEVNQHMVRGHYGQHEKTG